MAERYNRIRKNKVFIMLVIGVFKTHFDYGYTDTAENIRKKYREEIIAKVIDVCDETKERGEKEAYRWTLPAWLLMDIYDHCAPSIRGKLTALIQEDKITCHALPFTVHTELMSGRQMDDLFVAARRYSQTFCKAFPISAKMTDVPGHTSALIEPLVKAGVRFLHLGKNPYSTAPDVPLLFWWEDKNGNRILTMYTRFYGSRLRPPRGWKYPVWMALNQTGDNEGGHSVSVIEEMKRGLPKHWEFRTGSMDDFARELFRYDLSDLPVVRGELGDTWIHGGGTYPGAMGRYRRTRSLFYRLNEEAEKKHIDISSEAEEFRDIALQVVEHTFGINICRCIGYEREYEKTAFLRERESRPEYALAEKSWEEQRERVSRLETIAKGISEKIDFCDTRDGCEETKYSVALENGKPVAVLPSGRKVYLDYEYRIIGADKLHLFMKKYLVRFNDWSTVDFGKDRYPEIGNRVFRAKAKEKEWKDGALILRYETVKESYSSYGNATAYTLTLKPTARGVAVRLFLSSKQATPFVEAGNMIFSVPEASGEYIVEKCGKEIDVEKDIVKNANHILWAMDEYARIGNVKLSSIDAPLISFGKNAIMEWNGGGKRSYKPKVVINLFNNQWGTNFPQWIEGNFNFEFVISEADADREKNNKNGKGSN